MTQDVSTLSENINIMPSTDLLICTSQYCVQVTDKDAAVQGIFWWWHDCATCNYKCAIL